MSKESITVIGAGLVGCVMALYLAHLGYNVVVYESRDDPRNNSDNHGRSINLALSHRGIRTLQELNLVDELLKAAVPVYGRAVHLNSKVDLQRYSHHKQEFNYSISRAYLNAFLLDQLDKQHNISVKFSSSINADDLPKADYIIAADGASSHLRRQLQLIGKIQFSEIYSDHSYKELTIVPDKGKQIQENYLHIWPQHDFMLIALPNFDGSWTCTLFMPTEQFKSLDVEDKIQHFFQGYFPKVVELMPDYLSQYLKNPTSRLKTVQGSPWWVDDKILFIGDAAHAMLPFLGQGMNCGFEDCRILNELIQAKGDFKTAATEFAENRKVDTDAITELSHRNYLEMRHNVIDVAYLAKRKKEAELAKQDPQGFRNTYELVSYTSTPYREIFGLAK